MGKKIYNWDELQKYYDTGLSIRELRAKFGVSGHAVERAIHRGEFVRRTVKQVNSKPANQIVRIDTLKAKLIRENMLLYACAECGLTDLWNGKPLVLQIDHINGSKRDNSLSNLRLLCPNCHSQTDTYAGRKLKGVPRKKNS
jgi:5-methylcytosine-specific restriction endonuclease McrA